MAIWYDGQSSDEGFSSIIEAIRFDPRLARLVDYLELRLKGLRKPAFKLLEAFIDESLDLPRIDQRAVVKSILEQEFANRNRTSLITTPLNLKLIAPVLKDWKKDEQDGHVAIRLHGLVNRDVDALTTAHEHDPQDRDVWTALMVESVLEPLYWATHHIHESALLYEIKAIEEILARGEMLKAEPPNGDVTRLVEELAYYQQLICDWKEFKMSGQRDFPVWCETQGRDYAWASTYYYQ